MKLEKGLREHLDKEILSTGGGSRVVPAARQEYAGLPRESTSWSVAGSEQTSEEEETAEESGLDGSFIRGRAMPSTRFRRPTLASRRPVPNLGQMGAPGNNGNGCGGQAPKPPRSPPAKVQATASGVRTCEELTIQALGLMTDCMTECRQGQIELREIVTAQKAVGGMAAGLPQTPVPGGLPGSGSAPFVDGARIDANGAVDGHITKVPTPASVESQSSQGDGKIIRGLLWDVRS